VVAMSETVSMIRWVGSVFGRAFFSSLDSIGQRIGGIVFAGLVVVIGIVIVWRFHGFPAARRRLWRGAAKASPAVLIAWLPFYLWEIPLTAYRDVQRSTTEKANLVNANAALNEEKRVLTQRVVELERAAAREAEQCRLETNFVLANKNVAGAVTATQAIIHCNKKYESPVEVEVEFDREFIQGNVSILGASVVSASDGKRGRTYFARISSPPVLAHQGVVVTVQSGSSDYPRAIRGALRTAR
jgi:hypothetical protein